MDSVSQFALGASIGDLVLGKRMGKKAILIGGLLGTLPDLDVLARYSDAVESFTYHRSWSHSLIILSLLSPVIALGFYRFSVHRVQSKTNTSTPGSINTDNHKISYKRWLLFVWLTLFTHALLDGFTIYGTQLFWPLNLPPVAIGSIFIIDLLYTVPLLLGLWLSYRNSAAHKHRYAAMALFISTCYLGITLISQAHARQIAMEAVARQNIKSDQIIVAPFPFSVLWRIVVMEDAAYYEGFYSLFDQSRSPAFVKFDNQRDLIDSNINVWSIDRLNWFTQGMIAATMDGDQLIINDLRMGIENSYVFRFAVAQKSDSGFTEIESRLLPMSLDIQRLKAVVNRIWDESINVQDPLNTTDH